MRSEELICTKRELEIIIFEQAIRNQAWAYNRALQQAEVERQILQQMEKQMDRIRGAGL